MWALLMWAILMWAILMWALLMWAWLEVSKTFLLLLVLNWWHAWLLIVILSINLKSWDGFNK